MTFNQRHVNTAHSCDLRESLNMAAQLSAPLPESATLRDPITETLEITSTHCALSRGLTATVTEP